jgi:hypothetical protein
MDHKFPKSQFHISNFKSMPNAKHQKGLGSPLQSSLAFTNTNALNLITVTGIAPHPLPLPSACLPVGRGRGEGEGTWSFVIWDDDIPRRLNKSIQFDKQQ